MTKARLLAPFGSGHKVAALNPCQNVFTRAPPLPPAEKARCWAALVLSQVRFPRKYLLPASHLAHDRGSPGLGFWKILAPGVKKIQCFMSGMVSYI